LRDLGGRGFRDRKKARLIAFILADAWESGKSEGRSSFKNNSDCRLLRVYGNLGRAKGDLANAGAEDLGIAKKRD
jgi:hypothetical protein